MIDPTSNRFKLGSESEPLFRVYRHRRRIMTNIRTPGVTPITPIGHKSLTFLSGLVYGVVIPKTHVPPTLGGTGLKTYFALSRNVDWLSSQFAAALASGMSF